MSNRKTQPNSEKQLCIALEFATNGFGKRLLPETRARLEAVIKNPCEETWDDAYTIILSHKGRQATLWNAVCEVDIHFIRSKPISQEWPRIPSQETIIDAIRWAVFQDDNKLS